MLDVLWFLFTIFLFANGGTVCYEPFGCFSDEAPFDHYLMTNPKHPSQVKTSFTVHTPQRRRTFADFSDRTVAQTAKILEGRNLKIILHGLLESSDKAWVRTMTKGLLNKEDTDVIVMDYGEGATGLMATGNARLVGAQLAYLLKNLFKLRRRNGKRAHIIGFSLGAHAAGYAGKWLKQDGYKIGRITGLDPGDLPYGLRVYENAPPLVRLDKGDADFVDVIHTDISGLGIDATIGHLDFYPNGGVKQPGCDVASTINVLGHIKSREQFFHTIACNHFRAVQYFTESLSNSSCKFTAYPCESMQALEMGVCNSKCEGGACPVMGYDSINLPNATLFTGRHLYLQTHRSAPFCKKSIQPKQKTQSNVFVSLFNAIKSYFF